MKESEAFERFCKRFAGKMPAFPTNPKLALYYSAKWLTEQYKNSGRRDRRFYFEGGGGETRKNAAGLSMIETNQHLRDVLKTKGYNVSYLEYANAIHNPEHWRTALAGGIIYLMGKQ